MDAIPSGLLTIGGWGGLVALAVWFMFTDRLISRGSHLREVADKNDHITYLRKTLEVRDEQIKVQDAHIQRLLTNSDLTVQLLQSLDRQARRADG